MVWPVLGGSLRRRALAGYLLVAGCGLAAVFAYITGSPFVLESEYGLSPTGYSLVFASNALGTVAAGVLGVAIAATAMITLVVLLLAGISTLAATWAYLFGLTTGFGLLLPVAITIVLTLARPWQGCGEPAGAHRPRSEKDS